MAHVLCQYLLQKREDGRAQHGNARPPTNTNTACYMESKGTKQPGLPIRAALSDAYVTHTGKIIQHNFVSEAMFSDSFITSHDPHMLGPSFLVNYGCICKRGQGSGAALSVHSVKFFLHLYSHISLSLPCLCLYISLSLLNSPPALTQALLIAGSLLNSHNALL